MIAPFEDRPVTKWWFITLLTVFLISCSSKIEPESFPPLNFSKSDSLTGVSYSFPDQNIKLNVPKGFMQISNADYEIFNSTVAHDTSLYLGTEPLLAGSTTDNLFLVVSAVSTGAEGLDVFDDNYAIYLGGKYPTSEINRSQFSINGIPTVQYLISDPTTVAIKLYCLLDTKCTQIDYLLPRDRYSSLAQTIEASIGSITHKDEEGTR